MPLCNVVIQTAFIGDLYLSIPLLVRLKKQFPTHQTILVCKKGLGEFFTKTQIVDFVFEVEKGRAETYNLVAAEINKFQVDHLLCLHQSFRSTLFSYKIRAKNKIGFSSWYKRLIFDRVVPYTKTWPDVVRQISILAPIDLSLQQILSSKDWSYLNFKQADQGFPEIPHPFKFPQLVLPAKSGESKQVALFPGSVWETKKWTHAGYAEVANTLLRHGYRVSVMGGPNDQTDALEIKKRAPGVEILTGLLSLYESTVYIQNFDLIICNDSAPAHMAACLQRPVLSLFGPTVLDFGFRPWNDLSQVVEIDQLSCRPCGPHGHHQCPLGHHDCMKKIDPNIVSEKALKILAKNI